MLSIYGTVFNNIGVIDSCISSLVKQLDVMNEDYEIVICDNFSNDGTWNYLSERKKDLNLVIFKAKCSRGLGRALALSKSTGEIVSYVDFDTIINANYSKLYRYILDAHKTELSNTIVNTMTSRSLLDKLGSWRNLNASEDTELLSRTISKNLNVVDIPIVTSYNEAKKNREGRYSRGLFRDYKRKLGWHIDRVRGNGVAYPSDLLPMVPQNFLSDFSSLLIAKIRDLKIYKYGDKGVNNVNYSLLKKKFIRGPDNIGTSQYLSFYYLPLLRSDTVSSILQKLNAIGMNKTTVIRNNLLITNEDVDEEIFNGISSYISPKT